ncbi:hypothetical protein E4U09_003955 [Claviceps aff. purpurea]|uniref:Beta-mannosidase-like galactose-binding domain-containing protein n=1 Tax=Claviceps aff. purpurea TaxID=1967640 RepID=A0A9P7QDZ2_9HYPO|nr:hypothetical protein E4U09_003955 [Claviceps aff. purpurea]
MMQIIQRVALGSMSLIHFFGSAHTQATTVKPVAYQVQNPLVTDWTYRLGTNPWPEHPRPQLHREHWLNLNGIWAYDRAGVAGNPLDPPQAEALSREVMIPSCIESGLSGIQDLDSTAMWFVRHFKVPDIWKKQNVLLHFEAVDYEATVFMNNVKVGHNVGGYFRFTVDITRNLSRGQDNKFLWNVHQAIDQMNQTYEIKADLKSYNYRASVLFRELTEQVERYACSGGVWAQTTDVEGGVNGLYTQDVDFDVIIIGAGLSGINFAYRLQERNPNLSYCIVDGRHEIGGTWSLFNYPGIRSDSDLFTFGFSWRPWEEQQPIAQGARILEYIKASAAQEGIDKNIKFNHRVNSVDWSSESSTWKFDITANASDPVSLQSRFVFLGTGYYDYNEPLKAHIPGIDDFEGTVIHPQFWPKDLDYTNKDVVIIGSGATAVTLVPSMADKAAHTTMLQRSPTYILALPESDLLDTAFRFLLPGSLAKQLIRFKWILSGFLLTTFSKWFPRLARSIILRWTAQELPKGVNMDPHFTPKYNPWEQRMCLCPAGDFFKTLRTGKASVETGLIEKVTAKTIRLKSGREMHPDIIVTATGLKVHLAGGIKVSVDGQAISLSECFLWKGCMLENVPNLFMAMGYVDASWTLGADATAQLVCRILNRFTSGGFSQIVPRLTGDEKQNMTELPFMSLKSTYIQKGKSVFPRVGNSKQWLPRSYYWKDIYNARRGDVESGLVWSR